jgi:hypothetical protein
MRLVLEMAAATGTKRMNMRPISLLDDSTEASSLGLGKLCREL